MVKKAKACLNCRKVFEGDKCPDCGESATTESFKGRVYIFNTEDSKIAKNMKVVQKGEFAIKTR